MSAEPKTVTLLYFALLREQRGLDSETRATQAATAGELYEDLKKEYGFSLARADLRVSINGDFVDFDRPIADGDEIVFIPPVAGG